MMSGLDLPNLPPPPIYRITGTTDVQIWTGKRTSMTSPCHHAVGPAAMLDFQIKKEKEWMKSQFDYALKVNVVLQELQYKTEEDTSVTAGGISCIVLASWLKNLGNFSLNLSHIHTGCAGECNHAADGLAQ